MEIWQDIPGYEGVYQASNQGNIKKIASRNKQLKQTLANHGYYTVGLSKNKKQNTFLVHRLIAMSFLGIQEGKDINHIDGVKTNNRIENLQWCTRSENIRHSFKLGLSKNRMWTMGKVGPLNKRSRPVVQRSTCGQEVARFTCIKEAAFTTGIAASGISAAATGRQKTAGKCLWEFS